MNFLSWWGLCWTDFSYWRSLVWSVHLPSFCSSFVPFAPSPPLLSSVSSYWQQIHRDRIILSCLNDLSKIRIGSCHLEFISLRGFLVILSLNPWSFALSFHPPVCQSSNDAHSSGRELEEEIHAGAKLKSILLPLHRFYFIQCVFTWPPVSMNSLSFA